MQTQRHPGTKTSKGAIMDWHPVVVLLGQQNKRLHCQDCNKALTNWRRNRIIVETLFPINTFATGCSSHHHLDCWDDVCDTTVQTAISGCFACSGGFHVQVKVYELRKTVLEIVVLVLFIFRTPPPPESRGMLTLSHYHNLS